jgi:hypothetical protein
MRYSVTKPALIALLTMLPSFAMAQNPQNLPPDFGTPQRSAKLASSAGFIEILGIKLGMPAETALSILKSNNPTARITFARTNDYESAWIQNLPRTDPSRQFVYEIDVEPARMPPGDRITVGLTVPPSKQVVHAISRVSLLPASVAITNVVEGLRKKYGPETAGPGFKWGGLSLFDGSSKMLVWVFDTEGGRVPLQKVADHMNSCPTVQMGGMGEPDVAIRRSATSDERSWSPGKISAPCYPYVVLTAEILSDGVTQPGLSGATRQFILSTYDWPLIISSANAFYAFLDQSAQRAAAQAAQQAQQRGKDIKY